MTSHRFSDSLQRMMDGSACRGDIILVAKQLQQQALQILYQQRWVPLDSGKIPDQCAMMDQALDFIAHLFQRNAQGVFICFERYLSGCSLQDETLLSGKLTAMLRNTIHQELLKCYRRNDPIGHIFHRNVNYLVQKHENWVKVRSNPFGVFLDLKAGLGHSAGEESIRNTIHRNMPNGESFTHYLDRLTEQFLEQQGQKIPLGLLQQHVCPLFAPNIPIQYKTDPVFETEADIRSLGHQTVEYISRQYLNKYVRQDKLSSSDAAGMKKALAAFFSDLEAGFDPQTNFEYLNLAIPSVSRQEYNEKYRSIFEYIMRGAKKYFSAHW